MLISAELLDVFSVIPGMLEESDKLCRKEFISCSALAGFQDRIVSVLRDFFSWRWEFELSRPPVAWECQTDADRSFMVDDQGLIFATSIFYHNFHQDGRSVVLYNAGLLYLLDLASLWHIEQPAKLALQTTVGQANFERFSPLTLPSENLSTEDVAAEICKSVDYILTVDSVGNSGLNLLLPLHTLFRFTTSPRIKQWLLKLMRHVYRESGFGFLPRHAQTLDWS